MRIPTTSSLVLRERARAASAIAAAIYDAGGSRFEDCWTPSSGLLVERHTSSSSSSHAVASESTRRNRMDLFILVRILLQYLERVDPGTLTLAREVLKDCGRKHNTSESKYPTLADAIRERLRVAVGETHWSSARSIQRRLAFNQRRKRMANVMDGRRAERERSSDAPRSSRVAGHATLSPSSSGSSTAMASRK